MNNPSLEYIENRLSLRKPQKESLEVLDSIIDYILSNDDNGEKLRKIRTNFNYVTSFDREFPSLCFALATGVGKTRLMGAFIAYLYIVKNIKNFMVVAPNITIYNKLKSDFSDKGSDKYIFKGLKEFVQNDPKIVTGENYKDQGKIELWKSDITINIFNIDKINKEEQSIKSLSEYLGQSYYECLVQQENLVVLMDESHHYRADRGMTVLNELNPILGLELTATPQIEKKGKTIKFNNIIYDYPLAKAMIDGYVKEPSVATKKNFDASNFSEEQLDKIKLNDGLAIHEDTKVALQNYANNNDVNLIKPFTMVVCKDINHANEVLEYVESSSFYNGKYKGKVLKVTSKDGISEKDDNIQKLINLEKPSNTYEIVVHVNMLKEGWDVNNLYTIIPLRRSASQTLTEQTMGRGLRLPYGKRTGNEKVDRLTIVSHDKYQAIIDEANKEGSILKASNILYIDNMDLKQKESVIAQPSWILELDNEINHSSNELEKQELKITKEIKKEISQSYIEKIDLKSDTIKEKVLSNIADSDENDIEFIYDSVIEQNGKDIIESEIKNRINIPFISPSSSTVIEQKYNNFDLDFTNLNFKPLDNDILIRHLGDGENFEISVGNNNFQYTNVKELLSEKIINIPSFDYEKCSNILDEKLDEYIDFLQKSYDENQILNIAYNYSSYISKNIATQILSHMDFSSNLITEKIVKEYSPILNPSFLKYESDEIIDYRIPVDKSKIKSTIFNGFKKSCHNMYKFDSNTEKEFTIILENSKIVEKWLRPAEKQFNILWNKINRYEPDFVVETSTHIYMIEVKASNQTKSDEVQFKKEAAEEYCSIINDYGKNHNIKKWKYLIISDDNIKINYDFDRYI